LGNQTKPLFRPALLFVLLLFAGIALAQERPCVFRSPFQNANGLIVLGAPLLLQRQCMVFVVDVCA